MFRAVSFPISIGSLPSTIIPSISLVTWVATEGIGGRMSPIVWYELDSADAYFAKVKFPYSVVKFKPPSCQLVEIARFATIIRRSLAPWPSQLAKIFSHAPLPSMEAMKGCSHGAAMGLSIHAWYSKLNTFSLSRVKAAPVRGAVYTRFSISLVACWRVQPAGLAGLITDPKGYWPLPLAVYNSDLVFFFHD